MDLLYSSYVNDETERFGDEFQGFFIPQGCFFVMLASTLAKDSRHAWSSFFVGFLEVVVAETII